MIQPMEKNMKQTELDDKKISLAIMSSTVILTVQYFLLTVFNLMDTSSGSLLQNFSKGLVALIFAYTFPAVLKENKMKLFTIYFIAIGVFLSHYLFFSKNREYLSDIAFPLFFMSLPVFVYALSLKDWSILKKTMKQASVIVFVCGFFLSASIFTGIAKIDTYSMAFSYYMLLPSIIFLDELLDKFSMKAIFISSISIISILAIGSRGALLCMAVFVVLKLIDPTIPLKFSKVRIFIIAGIISISTLIILNLQSILLMLYNLLLQFGLNSRSIVLLLSGEVYLSGRDNLYGKIMTEIINYPLFGLGLTGDRLVLKGTYSHNIFLELLSNFGVIFGGFIILFLVMLTIGIFFVKDSVVYNLLIIWISLGFISLFVSGSYLTELSFWTYLGLIIRTFFFQNEQRQLLHKQ